MKARKTAPTQALGHQANHEQSFRIWSYSPAYMEDETPWRCIAAFRFLKEALDYIAYCQDRGADVVFQSPADCKPVKASERRVVYRSEGGAA